MIRSTHGFHHGPYYWECEIRNCNNENSFVRVGWSTRFGELQAPLGYDINSYSFCSQDGKIKLIILNHYSKLLFICRIKSS